MPDKKELRTILRNARREQRPDYVKSSDKIIFDKLISLSEYIISKRIFCYCSVEGEVDTHAIIGHAKSAGKRVFLPVVYDGGVMEAVELENFARLIPGKLSIPEPPRDGKTLVPEANDIAIVPALAYNEDGYRLGQGGGYYDRFLKDWPGISVGLCRKSFIKNEIPVEVHDVKVDILITD